MKKLFTLALALCVTFVGYSQVKKVSSKDTFKQVAQEQILMGNETFANVSNVASMVREENLDLDYTTYDWQTNTAAKNWTMTFPDGSVGFTYTIATDESYSDRGTGIAIYNPNTGEWTTTGGKIENRKTGFGCATRYGENGIVVVSRDASTLNCGVYIIEDKDNLPAAGTVAPIIEWTKDDRNIHYPTAMCTGPNHDHIHILFTGLNYTDDSGQTNPFYYFRSLDGGQTWDEFMSIEYLGYDYAPRYFSGQDAYFMENTGGDRLDIVVNTRRGDGVVLTSLDEGNTWDRTLFYKHPGIYENFVDANGENIIFMYPRWTSALWDNAGNLHVAYEFGGGTGDSESTSYYPSLGGVAYWNSAMPYRGDGVAYGFDPNNPNPPVHGQPFIMDTAYLYQDIYASWWLWSDATHEMWPEYIGYLTTLDENGDWEDPYTATEFKIEDRSLHGHYNCGICAMPVLTMTPNKDLMVALWMSMDENNADGIGQYYMKLFTCASTDGGNTWTTMKHLTNDFTHIYSECVYPQAAITGNQLVIACQVDGETDSFVIGSGGDQDQFDNCYQGFVYDLYDLFGYDAIDENPVSNNTVMSVYPNPATDQLNITLNQNEEVVIYNMVGQAINSFKGHVGINRIDLSNLNSGVYFISAGSATQKFVVK